MNKVEIDWKYQYFIVTDENRLSILALFALMSYPKDTEWMEPYITNRKFKWIYTTTEALKLIDEYINDNSIRREGVGGSNSSIPK